MLNVQSKNAVKVNVTRTNGLGGSDFRILPRGGSRLDEVSEVCERVQDLLSAFFSISGRELRAEGRLSADISRIRQIGMYISHVVVRLTMQEVGYGFQRDRSTVAHACHVIEDLRDNPEFEILIRKIERIAEITFLRPGRC